MANCTFCNRFASDPDSALCPWHLDLEVLVDYLADNGTPVTVDALSFLIGVCQSKGGSLVITQTDLSWLITPETAKKYNIAGYFCDEYNGQERCQHKAERRLTVSDSPTVSLCYKHAIAWRRRIVSGGVEIVEDQPVMAGVTQ